MQASEEYSVEAKLEGPNVEWETPNFYIPTNKSHGTEGLIE